MCSMQKPKAPPPPPPPPPPVQQAGKVELANDKRSKSRKGNVGRLTLKRRSKSGSTSKAGFNV